MATTSAEARVLPVSSKTRKDRANWLMMPPAAPSVVAAVMRVKFRVQRVCFMAFTSLL